MLEGARAGDPPKGYEMVSADGAALTNLVFAPETTPVVELASKNFAPTTFGDLATRRGMPYVSIDGLRILQRLMKTQNARIGDIKVENLVDSSVVKKVDESGFFERLYAEYGVK